MCLSCTHCIQVAGMQHCWQYIHSSSPCDGFGHCHNKMRHSHCTPRLSRGEGAPFPSPNQPSGHAPASPGGHAPASPGGYAPASPGGPAPASPGGPAPASPGSHAPASPGGHAPASPGGHAPASPGGHAPASPGGHAPASRGGHTPASPGGHAPASPGDHAPASPGHLIRFVTCSHNVPPHLPPPTSPPPTYIPTHLPHTHTYSPSRPPTLHSDPAWLCPCAPPPSLWSVHARSSLSPSPVHACTPLPFHTHPLPACRWTASPRHPLPLSAGVAWCSWTRQRSCGATSSRYGALSKQGT